MDVNQPSPPHHTAGNRQHKDLDPRSMETCMDMHDPCPSNPHLPSLARRTHRAMFESDSTKTWITEA